MREQAMGEELGDELRGESRDAQADDDLTDDALAGDWRVFQRLHGHRYSLDDTLVAWVAARFRPDAARVLDLGCGIGSVLLMLAYKLPRARFVGIEAQEESFALVARNVARNDLISRARLVHGDLRETPVLEMARAGGAFDLVTGTPPYQPPGTATPSPDAQRAHARMELRGGVEAYVHAAKRALAPDGLAVVCADARKPERVRDAARDAGLVPVRSLDTVPRAGAAPLFTVWTLAHRTPGLGSGVPEEVERFLVREADGARSAASREVRRFFDLPLPDDEAPSPRLRARRS